MFVSLSANPTSHPLIHSSIHLANPLPFCLVLLWVRRYFPELKNLKVAKRFYFFFHTCLKSSIDYTAYSCYHIYALLQASFLFSSSRLPSFRDLRITARRMMPLSSSFSPSLVGGDLKFCFKTATVPILLNPPLLVFLLSPPFLLSILPNPSELQSELLKTQSTLGSQLHR